MEEKELAIIKMLAYQRGIFVPDELYEELSKSAYSGYRTTSGVFFKFGGTKVANEVDDSIAYEDYLSTREWATSQIFKMSDIKSMEDMGSFLTLGADKDGNLFVNGQYVDSKGKSYELHCDDVGMYQQGNYDDSEAVAIQAGGIRGRVSICGSNCVSGCKFCSFGSGADKYKTGTFTDSKLNNYIKPLIQQVVEDQKISQLFITGGNPSLDDMKSWTYFLEESIKQFKKSAEENGISEGLTVDVMLTPRGEDRYVYDESERKEHYLAYCQKLKKLGVTSVSPNMELWSQDKLDEYCPGENGVSKSEIGQAGYLDFIDSAVQTFGPFNVRSALIVGLNSIEETKQAIDELIKRGCYVTLSPFKAPEVVQQDPRYGKSLRENEPSVEDLIELSIYLKNATDNFLQTLPTEMRKRCEENIERSLNAHNTHNTANLCSGRRLDRLERRALREGADATLVRNVRELMKNNAGEM